VAGGAAELIREAGWEESEETTMFPNALDVVVIH